ncbi:MAG: TIR domain-containing protein, partial [Myxococcales bacterium]|nr:TIR domain-containing protein [Myxococcales bacterium]
MGTRFFLSYARGDWDDLLSKFFELLVREVRSLAAIDAAEVAYRDQSNLDIGEHWKDELCAALSQTACLVCILTPTYFTRPYCGREFEFFRRRIARFSPGAPLVLPVLWIPPNIATPPYPAVVTDIQHGKDFPAVYAEKGLRAIMRERGHRHRAAWQTIRDGFVNAIVERPAKHPLPAWADHPTLETLPNIFSQGQNVTEHGSPGQVAPGSVRPALSRVRRFPPPAIRPHVVPDPEAAARLLDNNDRLGRTGIFGPSGSGKTSLAAYAAAQYRGRGDVLWLEIGELDLGMVLEMIASALGDSLLGVAGLTNQATRLRAVTEGGGHLIVFDNVPNDEAVTALLGSVGEGNAVIITGVDGGLASAHAPALKRIQIKPLSPENARSVLEALIEDDELDVHADHEAWERAVASVVTLAAGQPAVLEVLAGELRALGVEAAPRLELTIRGVATKSVSERLRQLGARTVGGLSTTARAVLHALHVFSSNSVSSGALARVAGTGPDTDVGLRELQRRMLVARTGMTWTFHDYVRRLSNEDCDAHEQLVESHAWYYLEIAERFGGYEWNARAYPSLVAHEDEVIPLLWRLLAQWGEGEAGVVRVMRLAFALSWFLHWRGLNDTRYRMCASVIEKAADVSIVPRRWQPVLANLFVDKGWVALQRKNVDEALELARAARPLLRRDRFFADELEAQGVMLQGNFDLAAQQFLAIAGAVPRATRLWHSATLRLAEACRLAEDFARYDSLLEELRVTSREPKLGSGEVIEDLRARILTKSAERAFSLGE